jgi:hypothetical protein
MKTNKNGIKIFYTPEDSQIPKDKDINKALEGSNSFTLLCYL